jgi:hypothetical protein
MLKLKRRDFLKLSTATGAVLVFPWRLLRNFVESPAYQSANQEPLDPLTIPKFAHDLTIPLVFAPTIVKNRSGQVIRHEYDVFERHTRVQILPPPFPMTTVLGYGGKVKPSGQTVLTSPGAGLRGHPRHSDPPDQAQQHCGAALPAGGSGSALGKSERHGSA